MNQSTNQGTVREKTGGRLLSSTDTSGVSIGTINPIRYRSYYYDTETGFYYLNTRYYSPEICRFLSPDSLIDNRSVNTQNLFSYCANNPVKNSDISGDFFGTIIGAVVGGIVGGVTAAINGDNVLAGIGIGAATGAISGFAVDAAVATGGVGGIVIAVVGGMVASGLDYLLNAIANDDEFNIGDFAIESTVGGISNVLSFGIGGGSLGKVGGNVIKNIINNAKEDILKNTTRFIAGKVVPKTTDGIRKNIAKNIFREVGMAVTETFCSSYATEVIKYVFEPVS